jgi:hypothetical protein
VKARHVSREIVRLTMVVLSFSIFLNVLIAARRARRKWRSLLCGTGPWADSGTLRRAASDRGLLLQKGSVPTVTLVTYKCDESGGTPLNSHVQVRAWLVRPAPVAAFGRVPLANALVPPKLGMALNGAPTCISNRLVKPRDVAGSLWVAVAIYRLTMEVRR